MHIRDPKLNNICAIKKKCLHPDNNATKTKTYLKMNPKLEVHKVYLNKEPKTPEYKRIALTRLRLSAHQLKIETGRWSRIPRDQRRCKCGGIEDEAHVLFHCPNTLDIPNKYRLDYNGTEDLANLMDKQYVSDIVFETLSKINNINER